MRLHMIAEEYVQDAILFPVTQPEKPEYIASLFPFCGGVVGGGWEARIVRGCCVQHIFLLIVIDDLWTSTPSNFA